MSAVGICFVCGKLMLDAVRKQPVTGVVRFVDGNAVSLHKSCAVDFDADSPVTAQERQEPPREGRS